MIDGQIEEEEEEEEKGGAERGRGIALLVVNNKCNVLHVKKSLFREFDSISAALWFLIISQVICESHQRFSVFVVVSCYFHLGFD